MFKFLSIIIPVLNNGEGLKRTLDAISRQIYPVDRFEVIVVDNGSSVSPKDIALKYDATFLEEHDFTCSPYSARNRGIEIAHGDVIVFLDATCAPAKQWLSEGIDALASGYDLIGGEVEFEINEDSSVGEVYDSLLNVRMKESIEGRQVAKAGNLFVKRKVIDSIGMFPEGLRSGGDVRWTGRAVRAGFKLGYSPSATVSITPRPLIMLVKKQFRVSRAMPKIWLEEGGFISNFIKKGILCFMPPNFIKLQRRVNEAKHCSVKSKFISLFLIGYFLRLVSGVGIFVGLANLRNHA